MLKWMGAAFLMTGCVSFGLKAVKGMTGRVRSIQSMIDVFSKLKWELEYSLPILCDLFLKTAEHTCGQGAEFLKSCANRLNEEEGCTVSEIWRQEACRHLHYLKPGDLDAVTAVGDVLGRYDVESQKNALSAAQEQLSVCLNDASEERRRSAKVYSTVSVAAGLFLVILLL